jgi:CRP-like cAMP-binding protein
MSNAARQKIVMLTQSASPAATLSRHAFLEGAPPEVLARLSGHARWFDAGPDQTIIDFEDSTTDVYLIVQGNVRVLVRTANGERTQILGDFAAGQVFGEMAAIDGVPRSARIEALVRTRMCSVPAKPFIDAVFASREIGLRLMRVLTARIRGQNRRLLELTALPIRLRLIAELLRLSRPKPDGSRVLSPLPTQEELASRIGARRETVSREISALTEAGMLHRTRAALVLHDPAALQAAVDAGLDQPRDSR